MIQLCIILYNDRVTCWHKLNRELGKPDEDVDAALVVDMNVRNKMVFDELDYYSKKKDFLWKHPILQKKKMQNELFELKKENPQKFLNEYSACKINIAQYKTKLKRKKITEQEFEAYTDNLKYYTERIEVFLEVINKR